MLLILAEHIMGAASDGPSPNGAGGLRPLAPCGEFIMCSASMKSNGLRIFQKHWPPMLSESGGTNMGSRFMGSGCFRVIDDI